MQRSAVAVLDNDCATLAELRAHPEILNVLELRDLRAELPGERPRSGSHALSCAGLIGGKNGIAPGTPLIVGGLPAKAKLQADFLRWAAGLPARSNADPRLGPPLVTPAAVISMSLLLSEEPELVAALEEVATLGRGGRGCVLVLAAGNLAQPAAQSIARYGHFLTVGASCLDACGREIIAPYSNHGLDVDLYARSGASMGRRYREPWDKVLAAALPFSGRPGWNTDELLRPLPGCLPPELEGFYCLLAGTSTSAALCAGAAARVLDTIPELDAAAVKNLLCRTARRIDSERGSFSRLDVNAAVAAARETPTFSRPAQRGVA